MTADRFTVGNREGAFDGALGISHISIETAKKPAKTKCAFRHPVLDLLRRHFHPGFAAGFSTLAANFGQVFRYRDLSICLAAIVFIHTEAVSGRIQLLVDNAEAESAQLCVLILMRHQYT